MSRSMDGLISEIEASSGEYGGEFDPAMGAEIHSENGRALIVVHEGFGMDQSAWKYGDDPEYAVYLRRLEATKQRYYENGDIVVLVSDAKGWYDSDHKPMTNTLYFSTLPNNGGEKTSVVEDGVRYSQSYQALFDALKEAGVDTVEMAGEFRGLCVSQVAHEFENTGNFDIFWCADCAFPPVQQMDSPESYPTPPPIVTPQSFKPLRDSQYRSGMSKSKSIRSRF